MNRGKRTLARAVVIVSALLGIATQTGYAQIDPCGADFNFSVTRDQLTSTRTTIWNTIGARMQRCDSLLLMSKHAFRNVVVERERHRAISDSLDRLLRVLEAGQDLRAALIEQQDSFIQFQNEKLDEYDALLMRSTQLVDDATSNTERALQQLEFYKFLSAGGIVLGAAGILIGAALAL